jgi:hypothetical protein
MGIQNGEQDAAFRRTEAFRRIAQAVNSPNEWPTVLDSITETVSLYTQWNSCWVSAVDFTNGHSVVVGRSVSSSFERESPGRAWSLDEGPARDALLQGRPLVIEDPAQSKYGAYRNDAQSRGSKTAVLAPIHVNDSIGRPLVLSCQSTERVAVDRAELSFLEGCVQMIALATRSTLRLRSESQLAVRGRAMASAVMSCLEALGRGGDMDAVLSTASRQIDAPMGMLDGNGELLAEAIPANCTLQARWRSELAGFRASLGASRQPDQTVASLSLHAHDGADQVEDRAPNDALQLGDLRIIETVVEGGTYHFAVMADPDLQPGPWLDLLSSAVAAVAMAPDIARKQVRKSVASIRDGPGLLVRYAAAGEDERQRIEGALELQGLSPQGTYRLITLRPETVIETAAAALEQDTLVIWSRELYAGFKGRVPPAAVVERSGTGLIALLPDHGQTQGEWTNNWRTATACCVMPKPRVTTSDAFTGLAGVIPASRQVTMLNRVAAVLHAENVVSSDGADVLSCLAGAAGAPGTEVVDRHLGPLLRYQRDSRKDLLSTLDRFLTSGGQMKDTSAALHIHVSTLQYRLKRIEEILGCSLSNPETRFNLSVVLKFYAIQRANSQTVFVASTPPAVGE